MTGYCFSEKNIVHHQSLVPAILESIELYEKRQVKPMLVYLADIKAMTHA
jgi:hypothetical protein